jgi:Peptidase propeptide and YPEB domain
MKSRAVQWISIVAAVGFWSIITVHARAEDDPAALAAAMKDATATLQGGLKANEREGTPISAKFEVEDGKLQLSVYTVKGNGFMEVVADPKTGTIAKAEKITDSDDLKAASSQKAAMARAKVPLLAAAETAVKANTGSQAVSIFPELKNGQAIAEVTLLQGTTFKKVTEKLD